MQNETVYTVTNVPTFSRLARNSNKLHSVGELAVFYLNKETAKNNVSFAGWWVIGPTFEGYKCYGPFRTMTLAIEYAQ